MDWRQIEEATEPAIGVVVGVAAVAFALSLLLVLVGLFLSLLGALQ